MGLHKGQRNSGSFKKGVSVSVATQFKKGQAPANKGTGKKFGVTIKCKTCGVEYVRTVNRGEFYCSKLCQNNDSSWKLKLSRKLKGIKRNNALDIWRSSGGGVGDRNTNWKGGVSKVDKLCRTMNEYYLWRSGCFERDNWTCQTCGVRGVYLTVHHIKGFSKIIKENGIQSRKDARHCIELWDTSNGVTLCEPCHKLTDNYKGKAKKS